MNRIVTLWQSFTHWLPEQLDRRVRIIAWLSLVFQVVLVGTGGTVRLTGSGLGCPTWPRCTPDSLINIPEQGIHGFIEFGNRLLAVVLGIIGVLAVLAVIKLRDRHPELFTLSILLLAGIPAQAVIGGISVLSNLNPYVVGIHFVISVALVVLATIFVFRVYPSTDAIVTPTPSWFAPTAWTTTVFIGLTIVVGILTTGSGPHAGDANSPRTGLSNEILEHVHSYPAYAVFVLTVILLAGAWQSRQRQLVRYTIGLLAIEFVQIAVGLVQARTGLPPVLVNIHMVLACVLAAAMTAVILSHQRAAISRTNQNGNNGSMPTATKSSVR